MVGLVEGEIIATFARNWAHSFFQKCKKFMKKLEYLLNLKGISNTVQWSLQGMWFFHVRDQAIAGIGELDCSTLLSQLNASGEGVFVVLDAMQGFGTPPPLPDITSGGGGGVTMVWDAFMPSPHCYTLRLS